jgi:hypothetical protein
MLRQSATAEGLATTLGRWEVLTGDRRGADPLLARIL